MVQDERSASGAVISEETAEAKVCTKGQATKARVDLNACACLNGCKGGDICRNAVISDPGLH